MLAHSVDERVVVCAVGALHVLIALLARRLVRLIVPSTLAASRDTAEKLGRKLALAPVVGVGNGDRVAALARRTVRASQTDCAEREREK